MSNRNSSTISDIRRLMAIIKENADEPIIQQILSECFDNKNKSSDTSQPSFVSEEDKPTTQPLREDEIV